MNNHPFFNLAGKLLTAFLLFSLYGCSNIQVAKAFTFFSILDEQGKIMPYIEPQDQENRALMGDVENLSAELFHIDSAGAEHLKASFFKVWNKDKVETEWNVKDSLGKVLISRKSILDDDGRLLRREAYTKKIYSVITSSQKKEDGGTRWYYTRQDTSSSIYKISFLVDETGKTQDLRVIYPFAHKLERIYNEQHNISSIQIEGQYHGKDAVSFTYDSDGKKVKERSVSYNGKLYSYESIQRNQDGKIVDLVYSSDISDTQEHTQYEYGEDGRVSKIISGGFTKFLKYEDGKLVREEYYDYAGNLHAVTRITTDDFGNVIESVYSRKDPKTKEFKEYQKYKYQIRYYQ